MTLLVSLNASGCKTIFQSITSFTYTSKFRLASSLQNSVGHMWSYNLHWCPGSFLGSYISSMVFPPVSVPWILSSQDSSHYFWAWSACQTIHINLSSSLFTSFLTKNTSESFKIFFWVTEEIVKQEYNLTCCSCSVSNDATKMIQQ